MMVIKNEDSNNSHTTIGSIFSENDDFDNKYIPYFELFLLFFGILTDTFTCDPKKVGGFKSQHLKDEKVIKFSFLMLWKLGAYKEDFLVPKK